MGQNIKTLRNRIKSVKSTLHLTKAMGLVASSKVRKAQIARSKSLEYRNSVGAIVDVLLCSQSVKKSAYLNPQGQGEYIIVIAGDRGLAGGYNANIFKLAKEQKNATIYPIGKKACERFESPIISSEHFSYEDASALAKEICSDFANGKYASVSVIYTAYKNMLSQEPQKVQILPLVGGKSQNNGSVVFEPSEEKMLELAVPTYVTGIIYSAIKESFACEVIARRNAMDSAGKNATTMIDDLQLKYNRARQGAITQEITEIVAGSGE